MTFLEKNLILILILIENFSCKSIERGVYEGQVSAWEKESGGEYPVEYFEFDKNKKFRHYEIFCFPTFYGEGNYQLKGKNLYFHYFSELDSLRTAKVIKDSTRIVKYEIIDDTIKIGTTKFYLTKLKTGKRW